MAKAQGLVGNFNGKVGNMVGFKVSQSNNGTSQGVRIYQPVRNNPKTVAQAQQRAKYAPIFATYRALKSIIDRGQESKPYGNASRIAWLKKAFRSAVIPWTPQGSTVNNPVGCPLTLGSLTSLRYDVGTDYMQIYCPGVTGSSVINTIGAFSTAILEGYPSMKEGDQLTFVSILPSDYGIDAYINSIIIDSTSIEELTDFTSGYGIITVEPLFGMNAGAIIVSRKGVNGEHLRSTESIMISPVIQSGPPYDAASKQAAIQSYMASGATNDDWSEEPI